jgi:hypothetical protein
MPGPLLLQERAGKRTHDRTIFTEHRFYHHSSIIIPQKKNGLRWHTGTRAGPDGQNPVVLPSFLLMGCQPREKSCKRSKKINK